ncbi:hypothetical protein E3N88_12458 [Mikania micrantha]|uniref:Uncharacterized protein n=1 Tax=Mikania micrantha TaxID=192012 RepID=A0A5N6P6W8_9ASTR|nr:hypothetical protein E3N88_12458 [Mikania micrantha]
MVAVFNKELLSWYLITLKLKETVDAGIPSSSRSIQSPTQNNQLQQQQQPLDALQIEINGEHDGLKDEPKTPESDWMITFREKLELAKKDDVAGTWGKLCIYKVPQYLRDGEDKAYIPNIRDMIMLENQIPLFVLDRLLGLQFGQPDQKGLVAKLALQFFDPLMPTDEPLTKSDRSKMESSLGYTGPFDPLSDQSYLHCLQVFRQSLLRRGPQMEPRRWIKRWSHTSRVADKRRTQLIHCVTELKEAGIKFKKRKTDRFWDIKFKNGVLRIPRLLIHDGTKSLFLNLIAFEQSHLDCGNEITSYVIFMDNLINSQEDVGYLHYCGIIEHWLGSDADVADLFNRLCQEVVFDINDSYLSELSEKVNRFYNHRWNSWRASLMHNYFSNPWAIISFIAAVILLILTSAQTFYGVYGYYRPPS